MSALAASARSRGQAAAAGPWLAVALGLSLAVGLAVAVGITWVLVSIALTLALALAILRWPFPAVAVLLVARTTFKNPFLDLLTLAGGTLALVVAGPRLPGRRVILPLGLFLLFSLPSVPAAPSQGEGLTASWLFVPKTGISYLPQPSNELMDWLRLASVLVAFMLTAWTVRDARRLRQLVTAALLSAVVPVAIGLKQLASGQLVVRSGFRAVEGPFTHPNYFAFYLVVVLTIGLVAFIEDQRVRVRLPLGALLALSLVCLFETYTRSAWIGFAGVVLLLGALRYRRLLVAGALVLVVAAFAFPSSVRKVEQRFGDLSSRSAAVSQNSWAWRTGEWRRMLPYGFAKPLTGQGYGSYNRLTVKEFGTQDPGYPTVADPAHPATSQLGFAAHNDYVRAIVETGVPGLVLWVLFLTGLVRVPLEGRRAPGVAPYAAAAAAIGIALIVVSASDNVSGYTVVLVYAAALAGGVAGAARGLRPSARP
jgi:O-antigen ligase